MTQQSLVDDITETVDIAIERLKKYEPSEGYYLTFSGGKDSIVIYDLAEKAGVKFEPHFHFTTVDPPELVAFIKQNYPSVIWDRPKRSMFELIERKGFFPTRGIRYCCDLLKEYGGKGRVIVTGVRREESAARQERKIYHKDDRFINTFYVNPIVDWKTKTVWDYIRQNNLKYCSLYDEGFERIGCIMCPLADSKKREREAKRWPKYYRAYLRAIERGIESSAKRGRISRISGGNAEETMRWWLYGEQTPCAEQCQLLG